MSTRGWLLQLKDRPYYWSRDGRWLKDIDEAKRFRSEHEAFTLSNQLHGAVVIPVEAVEGPRGHATKKKSKTKSAEWLRGERHGARAAAENVIKHGKSFAALSLRDLQANLRRGDDIEDFDRGYTHAYAETLKASSAKIQELGRPLTAAELNRDIQEALSRKGSGRTHSTKAKTAKEDRRKIRYVALAWSNPQSAYPSQRHVEGSYPETNVTTILEGLFQSGVPEVNVEGRDFALTSLDAVYAADKFARDSVDRRRRR